MTSFCVKLFFITMTARSTNVQLLPCLKGSRANDEWFPMRVLFRGDIGPTPAKILVQSPLAGQRSGQQCLEGERTWKEHCRYSIWFEPSPSPTPHPLPTPGLDVHVSGVDAGRLGWSAHRFNGLRLAFTPNYCGHLFLSLPFRCEWGECVAELVSVPLRVCHGGIFPAAVHPVFE